jgi:hypothetical protein
VSGGYLLVVRHCFQQLYDDYRVRSNLRPP